MTSPVELKFEKSVVDGQPGAVCHLLPCRIEHNETEVRAKEYFWPTIRALKKGGDNEQGRKRTMEQTGDQTSQTSKQPTLIASFRGRPLQGQCINLPSGFSGYVINRPAKRVHNSVSRSEKIAKNFDQFTYWNWDELPERSDSVVGALGWLDIAKAIHEPI